MRFYNQQHKYYCGIDLYTRKMYVCIIDQKGKTKVHQNIKTDPQLFFELVFPFLKDVIVGVECVFCWHPKGTSVGRTPRALPLGAPQGHFRWAYWLADLCADHKIDFVLGNALSMKAIHGGKTKNDKIDSYKIALLLKGGNFPTALSLSGQMARHP